jgi:hypothetical protein
MYVLCDDVRCRAEHRAHGLVVAGGGGGPWAICIYAT